MAELEKREIVIPGETIKTGRDFLPGDWTRREGEEIVANKFGLTDISGRLIKVIPLSGVYTPRKGNSVIGQIVDINHSGWVIDFGGMSQGFLPISEVPSYIDRNELREHFDFGDSVFAKVSDTNVFGRYIDLSIKMRNLGKLEDGMIIKINPNKVPRVIGKEGSMVNMIKDATNCNISVGQNGYIWLKAEAIEDEINTKKIIEFICEHSFIRGLTEKVGEFIEKQGFGKVSERSKKSESKNNSDEGEEVKEGDVMETGGEK